MIARSTAPVVMMCVLLSGCGANGPGMGPADGPDTPAGRGTVEIGPVPDSPEAFAERRYRLCRTPQGAAAAPVTVLLATNEDERTGLTCATMLLHPDRLRAGDLHDGREPGQHYRDLLRTAAGKPYIARSYLVGASPGNGYRPDPPLRVRWRPHDTPSASPERVRLMLLSAGADNPRPITLRRGDDGLWTVDEASSIFVGVRPPGG